MPRRIGRPAAVRWLRAGLDTGRGRRATRRARRRLRLARYWQAAADLDHAGRHAGYALHLARSRPRAPAMLLADIAVTLAEIEGDREAYAASLAHLEYALSLLQPATPSPDRDRLLTRTLLGLGDGHRRAPTSPPCSTNNTATTKPPTTTTAH